MDLSNIINLSSTFFIDKKNEGRICNKNLTEIFILFFRESISYE